MSPSRNMMAAAALLGSAVAAVALQAPRLADVAGRYTMLDTSDVAFALDQVGGGGIKGRFGRFSGSFYLKGGDLSQSTVDFELKPSSVVTGQDRIDVFLKSGAVFDTERFDVISFHSQQVEQTGPDTATVTGNLTAKGHTAKESFDVRLTAWNGRTIAFDVSGRVYRSHYAMDVGTPIYSNVVQFEMKIEGERR